jgi:hypothetical protein
LVVEEDNFKRELGEGVALVGEMIKDYQHYPTDAGADATRSAQAERQRQIGRLKIKLEDFGGEGSDRAIKCRAAGTMATRRTGAVRCFGP